MSKTSLDLLQRLFICPEGYNLMCEIAASIKGDDLGDIQFILSFYEAHKQTVHFLEQLIQNQIQKSENGTMFRGNNFCTRCLTSYTQMTMSNQYVINFIREPMKRVLAGEFNDVLKLQEGDTEAQKRFEELIGLFMEALVNTIELWPEVYRQICYVLYTESEIKQFQPLQCVGGFLILRIVCPCLIQPHNVGFCLQRPELNIMKVLTLICKTIQCIANASLPHEHFLQCFKETIQHYTLQLQIALTGISTTRMSKLSYIEISEKQLDRSIAAIMRLWKDNIKVVNNFLQKQSEEFKQLANAVLKYSSKKYSKKKYIKKQEKIQKAIAQLFTLAKQGTVVEVEKILKKHPEIIDYTDVDMMSALHYACLYKNEAVAVFLVKNNANLYLQDAMGFTCVHYACYKNLSEVLHTIMQRDYTEVGIITEEGDNCLHYLIENDFTDIHERFLEFIVKQNPVLINTPNYNGDTPMHKVIKLALQYPGTRIRNIKVFMSHKANPKIENNNKITPLSIAIKAQRNDLVQLMGGETEQKKLIVVNAVKMTQGAMKKKENTDYGEMSPHQAFSASNSNGALRKEDSDKLKSKTKIPKAKGVDGMRNLPAYNKARWRQTVSVTRLVSNDEK